jgi:hypothetical protein
MMSHSGEPEYALWKKLIDLGIFDDNYPLRLNACFRYLDVEKTQSFSLKVSLMNARRYFVTYTFNRSFTYVRFAGLDPERIVHFFIFKLEYKSRITPHHGGIQVVQSIWQWRS